MDQDELSARAGYAMTVFGLAMLGNIAFYALLTAGTALVVLKAIGVVAWSWNVVLAPWLICAVTLLALYWYCKPWEVE